MHDLVNILHALTVNLRPWNANIKPLQTLALFLNFISIIVVCRLGSFTILTRMLKRTCQANQLPNDCECVFVFFLFFECGKSQKATTTALPPHHIAFDCHANTGKCISYARIYILFTPIFLSLLFALINTSNKIQLLEMLQGRIGIMRCWLCCCVCHAFCTLSLQKVLQ